MDTESTFSERRAVCPWPSPPGPWAQGACLLVCTFVGLLLFGFAASERNRLSPLFAPIPCETGEMQTTGPATEKPDPAAAAALTNATETRWRHRTCHNPNQIKLTTVTREPGRIEWKEESKDRSVVTNLVGRSWVDRTTLEMSGTAKIKEHFDFKIDGPTLLRLTAAGDQVLHHTSVLRNIVELSVLGVRFKFETLSPVYCIQMVNYAEQKNGRLGCGSDPDNLQLYQLDDDSPESNLDYIEDAEADMKGGDRRDTLCGLAMAIFGALAVVCFVSLFLLVRPILLPQKTGGHKLKSLKSGGRESDEEAAVDSIQSAPFKERGATSSSEEAEKQQPPVVAPPRSRVSWPAHENATRSSE